MINPPQAGIWLLDIKKCAKSFEVPQKSSSFYLHENFFMVSWFFFGAPHEPKDFNTARLALENGWVGLEERRSGGFFGGSSTFSGDMFQLWGGYQHGIPVASTLLNTPVSSSRKLCAHRAEAVLDSGWKSQMFGAGKTRLKQGCFAWTTTSLARQLRWNWSS